MKPFLYMLLGALLVVAGATAQQVLVPTRPPGDNTNAAASTAFVTNAVASAPGGNAITALTGDVVATGPGSVPSTIQPGIVTSAKMAAGAAATNVGSLGGSLTGTLPNPTVANAAISAAMLAASAAASNVGTLGGDLTGTLPNPTIASGAVTSTKMASGAAATNVGTLGGDLTGTLPNPTVANGAITSAKMASGAAATNVGTVGGSLTGTLPNPTIANNAVTAAMLASGAAYPAGYCVIDGKQFASTIAGIQSAINTSTCFDIYVPSGTYSGTALLQIARSNVRLHGAGGVQSEQAFVNGTKASTILSFSCFNAGANPAFEIGDTSVTLTYGGIDVSDLAIALPATCNMIGMEITTSATDVPNAVRRVRVTQASGTASGTGIFLGTNVYNWLFESVVIDHFSVGYRLSANNNFTKIINGSVSDGAIGVNAQNSTANENAQILISAVDFENITTTGVDIGAAEGFVIENCYFGQGSGGASALSIRLGNVASQIPLGVVIVNNLFNAGGASNYAIELDAAGGFSTLSIHDNYFVGFLTDNVHNLTTTTGALGAYFQNHIEGSQGDLSSNSGFDFVNFGGAWTTYTLGPSCGTATFSNVTATFKIIGKITHVKLRFTINVLGTCAGNVTINMPNTINGPGSLTGLEFANTGIGVNCAQLSAATMACVLQPTNSAAALGGVLITNKWAAGYDVYISGVYEST